MIDWSRPIRRVGFDEVLKHKTRNGTDHWVFIGNERVIYSGNGAHVRYEFEPVTLPRLENVPMNELQRFAAKRLREARANRRREQEMAAMEHLEGFGSFA